ncbi:hypothetical protein BCR44DRAFT_126761 [Catenaria anguillulae PL171]|uniref:Cytochrome c oxidase assembly factor 3 n=1 Tax=Catenaria anguillulae PL171 TaxID=765915 RepID=A0A1Y2HVG5_9FUNG|nr:hypothetical protein BCR44DRAFT_126761 [Catenaria anguillulae PL171]
MTDVRQQVHEQIRKPFRGRNALIGLGLFGFCASVFTYSITAVKQESFEDVDAIVAERRRQQEAAKKA